MAQSSHRAGSILHQPYLTDASLTCLVTEIKQLTQEIIQPFTTLSNKRIHST